MAPLRRSLVFALWLSLAGGFAALRAAELEAPGTTLLAASEGSEPHADRVQLTAAESKDVPAEPKTSDAERISRLQRGLETDDRHLTELKRALADPEGEYPKADADFKRLDVQLDERKKALAKLPADQLTEAEALRAELDEGQKKWQLAKQRFELAIQERKALQSAISALEQKLSKDREALEQLLKPADSRPAAPLEAGKLPTANDAAQPPAGQNVPAAEEPRPPVTAGVVDVRSLVGPLAPALAAPPAPPVEPGLIPPGAANTSPAARPKSKELTAAAVDVKKKEAAAKEAQAAAQSLTTRTEILERNIELERTLLDTAYKMGENAEATLASLEEEFNAKLLQGAESAELFKLRQQIADVDARLRDARAEARNRARELDSLHSELSTLHAEQIAALQEAEVRADAARSANLRLAALQNPFSLRNLVQWLLDHGPRVATILLIMGGFLWLSRSIETRLVDLLAQRNSRGTPEERENRAWTLVGVLHNAAGVLVFSGGTLTLLNEIGIPIGPLMGGAAVIGLAVAFGAQTLIKDYFSGFMILLEQQYLVNDVVKIGEISGQVERITLRMTALRDLEGRVHFIPHGEIGMVTNMTHGWSRAVFDIHVAYKEDVDRVMNVLVELGRQLREDPQYYNVILEDPEMLGVDALGDSAVIIKFCIKTRPLKQWLVKRELLRRIKNKFDELKIEIPYPSHTIFHRHPEATSLDVVTDDSGWSPKRAA